MEAQLLQAQSYRQFLKLWVDLHARRGKKVNFSSLTRKAGFSSRSYIREIIDGKKSMTPGSLPKFLRALDLKGCEARFFQCLVALEEPAVDIGLKNPDEIPREMIRVREKCQRKLKKPLENELKHAATNWAFKARHIGEVFAALGDAEQGASLGEIRTRTGLSQLRCQQVLGYLLDQEAVVQRHSRFFASNSSVDVFGLGDHLNFETRFQEALLDLQKKSKESFSSRDQFFFHSNFSIRRSEIPELKERLKEVLIEFMDEAQDDLGDKVAKLTLGFYL